MSAAAAAGVWSLWLSVAVFVLLSTDETSSVFLPKEIRGFTEDEAKSVERDSSAAKEDEGGGGGGIRRRMDDAFKAKATNRSSKTPTTTGKKTQFFKDDADIYWYLKIFDRKVMIWSCKNAIQSVTRDGHSSPYLDLSCNVIGKFWSISWHHKDREIASYVGKFGRVIDSSRYSLSVTGHLDRVEGGGGGGHRFSSWNDVHLRIQNASDAADDSGIYRFTVTHWDGPSQHQKIYVDLTTADKATRRRTSNERHRPSSTAHVHHPLH